MLVDDSIIIKAIDYIKNHLEEELSVEDIAEHCHFSKYYFNRCFKEVVGESIYAFIKRLRLERTAFKMTREDDKPITEICNIYGYSSSNYSTAFKKHFGTSPIKLKNRIKEQRLIDNQKGFKADLNDKSYDYYNDRIEYIVMPDIETIYQRFIGDYHNLGEYWTQFMEKHCKYYEEDSMLLEISYDDPLLTNNDRCITDICMTTTKSYGDECQSMVIPGGEFMKYNYVGPGQGIFGTFQGLLGIWAASSPFALDFDKRKMITRYHSIKCDEDIFDIDIYIPII